MKNVSIIQSAITQRDCFVSGWSWASASAGQVERRDHERRARCEAKRLTAAPAPSAGSSFCDGRRQLLAAGLRVGPGPVEHVL